MRGRGPRSPHRDPRVPQRCCPHQFSLPPDPGGDLSHRCGRSPRPATARDARAEPGSSAKGPAPPPPGPPSAAGWGSHSRPAALLLLLHTGLTAAPRRHHPEPDAGGGHCRPPPALRREPPPTPRRPSPAPHRRGGVAQPPIGAPSSRPCLSWGGGRGGRICTPHPGRPLPVRDGQGTYHTHLRRSPPRGPARSEEGIKSGAPFLRYDLRWGGDGGVASQPPPPQFERNPNRPLPGGSSGPDPRGAARPTGGPVPSPRQRESPGARGLRNLGPAGGGDGGGRGAPLPPSGCRLPPPSRLSQGARGPPPSPGRSRGERPAEPDSPRTPRPLGTAQPGSDFIQAET